ncbi:hypothetical protein LA374_00425 [Aeromonas schubertii]|uniref:Uncharacterized protein n=1 Tax=Aeromonas schubertii TaxID=652 RepID=A0ABS7V6N3_9GAMM|nr:hypothetical protein [Aeromonas schubertii]MBZ6064683.1 hypothetical protein [Aeromonas schubertii]
MAITQHEWMDIMAAQSFVADKQLFAKAAAVWGGVVGNCPGHLQINHLRHVKRDLDQALEILAAVSARVDDEMEAISQASNSLPPHLSNTTAAGLATP